MKFDVFCEIQRARPFGPDHERTLFAETLAQAVLADELGFGCWWEVEHHGAVEFSWSSAPEVFLTWVAAKTSRIRLGHGVVCMPFNYNHPVRAAERAAMLDVLSNGRLDLGAGRGATLREMSTMGVDPARTYAEVEEALRMIGSMWRGRDGEEFEWHGELLQISPASTKP